jgi:poly(3-hydroxyalkanoate) depolymerase
MATVRAAQARSVVVGGQQLRVAIRPGRAASASRPALLLINGIGVRLEMLEPLVRELDPDVDVITFDPPGIGGSAPPPVPYRFTGLCGLISRLLTELGYDRVDILGISWGGGVAQHFALFRGARCRRLVLASTATGALMVPARPWVLAQVMALPPRRQMDREYLYRVVGEVFGGSARTHPERAAAAMSDGDWLGSPLGYLYQLTATAGWTSLPFLPVIRQPALILAGDDDPIIPLLNARLMNLLIPGSRLHVYHGGHLGLATDAAELAPVVDAFLAAPLYDGVLRGFQLLRAANESFDRC